MGLESQRRCKQFILRPELEILFTLFPISKRNIRSAYHHYSKHASALIKEELIKEGKDSSLGVIVSVVSAKVSCSITKSNLNVSHCWLFS